MLLYPYHMVALVITLLPKTIHHTINFTMTEAELFTIRCRINQAIQVSDASNIIIITNAIHPIR